MVRDNFYFIPNLNVFIKIFMINNGVFIINIMNKYVVIPLQFSEPFRCCQDSSCSQQRYQIWCPTPVLQQPLDLGVDFSLHSVTKFIGGHSDLMVGAVIAKTDSPMLKNLRIWQQTKGAVPSPFDCWLALRGVQSLSARMNVHCSNAMEIATFLNEHPKVEAVHYPGLTSDPGLVGCYLSK